MGMGIAGGIETSCQGCMAVHVEVGQLRPDFLVPNVPRKHLGGRRAVTTQLPEVLCNSVGSREEVARAGPIAPVS